MAELFSLRPRQAKALDMLRDSFRAGSRKTVIQAPCGFGKTIIGAHMIDGALRKRNRVGFCVPMISLIDQTFERFRANGISPGDMGVMQGNHPWRRPHAPIQICSIQTLASRGFPETAFNIVDECHIRFAALDRWMRGSPDKLFVGLSATPWARGMGEVWNDLVIPATIRELIDDGLLSPFRVFAASHPDLSGVKTVAGDYHEGQLAEIMGERKIVADVVANWLAKGEDRQTLCFAVDLAHAGKLAQEFTEAGVSSAYIDGQTERAERQAIMAAYSRGEIKVICSVGTMTTGVDVPCQCLILARPTKSEMLFVQIIGRGLRTEPGKRDCIIFDHTDTHLRLGMVTDIYHAELRTDARDREKAEREKTEPTEKTPLPRECSACGTLIPPATRACPTCGAVPMRHNTVEAADGELYEYGTERPPGDAAEARAMTALDRIKAQGKQDVYSQLVGMQGTRSDGWVAHKYRDIFGVWPRGLERKATAATVELKSYVHHMNIKFAKGRDAERQARDALGLDDAEALANAA